jgi:hypothetical protein
MDTTPRLSPVQTAHLLSQLYPDAKNRADYARAAGVHYNTANNWHHMGLPVDRVAGLIGQRLAEMEITRAEMLRLFQKYTIASHTARNASN